jgi:hypothetical protein
MKVGRRVVLKVLGASSFVSLSLPACSKSGDDGTNGGFFTEPERRAVGALSNAVVPSEEGSPGANELGAAAFIERLLTAFDVDPPAIFADGPYSGRAPLPDGKGGSNGVFPDNDFLRFRRLDRVSELAWRIKIYGSSGTAGGLLNDGIVAPVTGLRNLFKNGIAKAMASAPAPIESLAPDALNDAFGGLDAELQAAFLDLVPQAVWGAPEYGGNPDGAGWKLVNVEGDTQPFGYSILDESTGIYHERVDKPMSIKDPGPDPAPLDDATRMVLAEAAGFENGKVFS